MEILWWPPIFANWLHCAVVNIVIIIIVPPKNSLNNGCLIKNNLAQTTNKSHLAWTLLRGAWPHIILQYGLHEAVGVLRGVSLMPFKTDDFIVAEKDFFSPLPQWACCTETMMDCKSYISPHLSFILIDHLPVKSARFYEQYLENDIYDFTRATFIHACSFTLLEGKEQKR